MFPIQLRSLHRLLYVGTASLIALLALVLIIAPSTAQSEESVDTPDAPGSISGTVTDQAGEPLAGIEAALYHNRQPFRQPVVTDQSGQFALTVLGAGTYQVGFNDPDQFYGSMYYDQVSSLSEAADILVAGQDVDGIDAVLSGGGTISGTVTFSVTANEIGHYITVLWQETENGFSAVDSVIHGDPIAAGSENRFEFHGLGRGTYYICAYARFQIHNLAVGESAYGDISECYDGFATMPYYWTYSRDRIPNSAIPIELTNAEMNRSITWIAGDGDDRGTIAGSVQSSDGEPITNAQIELMPVDVAYHWGMSPIFTGYSDEEGQFLINGVAPETYYVRFIDPAAKHLSSCYESIDNCHFPIEQEADAPTIVHVAANEALSGIDARLKPASTIRGQITINDRTPPESAYVVTRLDGAQPTGTTQYDSATGVYTITRIPPGTYTVGAWAYIDSQYFQQRYGADENQDATRISVGYGDEVSDINIDLEPDAYEGVIQGSIDSNGAPLEDIRVEMFYGRSDFWFPIMEPLLHVDTDINGAYHLEGFARGLYSTHFVDPTGRYASVYSDSLEEPYKPETYVLEADTQTITKSATLTLAGLIRGHVLLPDHMSPEDYRIQPYHMTAEVLNGCSFLPTTSNEEYCWFSTPYGVNYAAPTAELNADGSYTLEGLYPGTYRISIQRKSPTPYSSSWDFIQFYPLKRTIFIAHDVIVTSEAVVEDIDFDLTVLPRQFLPIAAR